MIGRTALLLQGCPANMLRQFFNKLKSWRWIATRSEKACTSYLDFVRLRSALLWPPFTCEA